MLTSIRVGLEGCSRHTGQIVRLPGHVGSRRAEAGRNYPLVQEDQSSDRNLAGEGIGQAAGHRSFGMAAVDRIGPGEVDSPAEADRLLAEEGNPGRSRAADILADCIGRKGLT
jgi:hypothetical protein